MAKIYGAYEMSQNSPAFPFPFARLCGKKSKKKKKRKKIFCVLFRSLFPIEGA
jgi:hypothetical protein